MKFSLHRTLTSKGYARRNTSNAPRERQNRNGREMQTMLQRFWQCDAGATAIEYALIASIISIAIVGTLTETGSLLVTKFESVRDAFNN